ncbi:DUF4124 domain-containing protein [Pseudomonas turukhanskensis]|uniref:DUF4124 domain-containing protein n=1 Tax=Pseudomonas turukhanskensis TaxID=1806536 RepID=A0A9W6KB25_9PSED|nr:DUF4124 domain-containing protein [Pseudomonas turukhanskensis]GLK91536.1 hypothetical protein GCM10017655_46000 [Pseudomonas turukhanskensis]
MKLAAIVLILLPACAQAQVYKCVASDGSTSYATVPCPAGSGETTRIIEPVPPSGVLNIPALAPPASADSTTENADASAETTDEAPQAPTVTGITVIEDSEEASREQKRTLMREEAEQHKKDMYDQDLRKKENQQRQEEYRQRQERERNTNINNSNTTR